MKWRHVALAFFAGATVAAGSGAQPVPSGSAAASAGKIEIPPWPERRELPPFDAEPFSDEKTPAPKLPEWTEAKRVALTRMSPSLDKCSAKRLREWMKIRCDSKIAGFRLIAGSTDGVALWIAESVHKEEAYLGNWQLQAAAFETMGRFGEIVFPVRRGDRRVFEGFRLDIWEGYEGPPATGSVAALLVEEQWPPDGKPEIVLLSR
jgi:hypothetical protein